MNMSNFGIFISLLVLGLLLVKFSALLSSAVTNQKAPYPVSKLGIDNTLPPKSLESFFRILIRISGITTVLVGVIVLIFG